MSSCISRYFCCCAHTDTHTHTYGDADAARNAWTKKWRDLLNFVRSGSGLSSARQSRRDLAFDAITRLYAHEDVDAAVTHLHTVAHTAPHIGRFYVPQLVNLLLYGALPDAEQLEVFLLDKCERSLHFAHTVMWYLLAYAPPLTHTHTYTSSLTSVLAGSTGATPLAHMGAPLLRAVEVQGTIAALRIARQVRLAAAAVPPSVEMLHTQPRDRVALRAVQREYANAIARAEAVRYREFQRARREREGPRTGRAARSSGGALLPAGEPRHMLTVTEHEGAAAGEEDALMQPTPLEEAAAAALISGARLAAVALRPPPTRIESETADELDGASAPARRGTIVQEASGSSGSTRSGTAQRILRHLSQAALLPGPSAGSINLVPGTSMSGAAARRAGAAANEPSSDQNAAAVFSRAHSSTASEVGDHVALLVAGAEKHEIASSPIHSAALTNGVSASGVHSAAAGAAVNEVVGHNVNGGSLVSPHVNPLVNHSRNESLPSASAGPAEMEADGRMQDAFYGTPAVCAELTRISYQLMSAPAEHRNTQLRLALGAVAARYLPSSTAYVPCGNPHNRLVGIHPDHSFCFKTKARVPYMAVLEVVDYANSAGGPLEDSDSDDDDDTRERARKLRHLAAAAATELGVALPDKRGMYGAPAGTSGRGRAGTLGEAQEAAAAAVAAVQAAFTQGARQASVVMTEGATAIKRFVTTKVNEMRGRTAPRHGAPADAGWHEDRNHGASRHVRGLVSPVRWPPKNTPAKRGPSATPSQASLDAATALPHRGTPGSAPAGAARRAAASPFMSPASHFRTPLGADSGSTAAEDAHTGARSAGTAAFVTPNSEPTRARDMAHFSGAMRRARSASSHSVFSENAALELPAHTHLLSDEEHAASMEHFRRSRSAAEGLPPFADAPKDSPAFEGGARGKRRTANLRALRRSMLPGDTPASLRKPLINGITSPEGRIDGLRSYGATHSPPGEARSRAASAGAAGGAAGVELHVARVPSAVMLAQMGQWASALDSHPTNMTPLDGSDGVSRESSTSATYEPPALAAPEHVGVAVAGAAYRRHADNEDLTAEAEFDQQLRADEARLAALGADMDSLEVSGSNAATGSASVMVASLAKASQPVVVVPPDGSPSRAVALAALAQSAAVADGSDEGAEEPGPVSVVFAERWRDKEARVAATSRYSHLPGWRLMPVIVKANDDLRQEQFVSQLMFQFGHIFRAARVPVWLRPYSILATSPTSGLIQAVPDTISIDALKRGDPHFTTLATWFERHFNVGAHGAERLQLARMNYVRSMAAYSIVCYILNIKDRHNGNILIDRKGHIIHIDFGFLLTNSPGGNINFEAAPFKLSQEYVEVMGGPRSELFGLFRKLCVRAFLAARKYRARIILLVEMMLSGSRDLPCFRGGPRAVMQGIRGRFFEGSTDHQAASYVHDLIDQSLDNWRTRWYDAYQRWAQGVF